MVTDNQRPEFIGEFAAQGLCSADKIRVVDHREILKVMSSIYPLSIPDPLKVCSGILKDYQTTLFI